MPLYLIFWIMWAVPIFRVRTGSPPCQGRGRIWRCSFEAKGCWRWGWWFCSWSLCRCRKRGLFPFWRGCCRRNRSWVGRKVQSEAVSFEAGISAESEGGFAGARVGLVFSGVFPLQRLHYLRRIIMFYINSIFKNMPNLSPHYHLISWKSETASEKG